MSKLWYPAVLERADDGSYSVIFPDVDGCFSAGNTAADAALNAEAALSGHLELLAETGRPVPEPSPLDVAVDPDIEVAARLLVGAEEPKAGERVNVWLPKVLVARIDRHVAEVGAGGSRSGFLALAARRYLERELTDA